MLEKGIKAPNFKLPDQNGNIISLDDFLGKRVVLYFYSKDMTQGCSRQAVAFKELYNDANLASDQTLALVGLKGEFSRSKVKV